MNIAGKYKNRGSSLVEILVSSVLVLLIMGEVWMMLQYGSRFYLRVRGQSEVQRSSLLAFRWLSRDLAETSSVSFRHYRPEGEGVAFVAERNGMVFGSARNMDGILTYTDTGAIEWSTMLAYYIDPETRNLYRTRVELDEPGIATPIVDDDVHHIDLLAALPDKRKIAENIENITTEVSPRDLTVTIHCRDNEFGAGLEITTKLEMKNR